MLFKDLFLLSYHNIFLHKVRSTLTSLGIIFGVGSVIAMLAISEGAKVESLAQIEAMGTDKIMLFSKKPALPAAAGQSDSGMVQTYGITESDLQALKKFDNVRSISTVRDSRKNILKGTTPVKGILAGVSLDFLNESKTDLLEGRWFSSLDEDASVQVCVIGKNVKKNLFSISSTNVVGEYIRFGNYVFKIIGIMENKLGGELPEVGSPNDMVVIPQKLSDALFGRVAYKARTSRQIDIEAVDYDLLIIKVSDISYIDDTAKRIKNYMQKTHSKQEDWDMVVPYDLLRQREKTQNIFTIIMSSIAGISLLVGGIGIMNIMLANVYERRKEIGTRMALGARKKDILFQFLWETVLLTVSGGLIGIFLGIIISKGITYYADWKVIFTPWSFILSFVISMITGVVFGTYPAWKASRQNPIEILRTE